MQKLTFKAQMNQQTLRPYSLRSVAMCTLDYTGRSECAAKTSQPEETKTQSSCYIVSSLTWKHTPLTQLAHPESAL